jgi:hypothetical protein
MNISQYISELLIDNDCVIIPGFGGFVANYQSAMVSGNAHVSFMPPSKQLLFNVKLNQNDGLLVTKISTTQNISYKQAEEQVEEIVHHIKKQLHLSGSFVFNGIGLLHLNSNNSIEFQPTVDVNLFADSFGLSTFMFPQLNYVIRSKQHVSFKHSSPKRHIALTKTVKRIAVVVPMLLLLAVLPTIYLRNIQQSSFTFLNSPKAESVEVVKSTHTVVKPISKSVEIVSMQTQSYHIIVGCFRNVKTAQNLCEMFKAKGFKSSVLQVNGMCKVSLQSFCDITAANNLLISFQDANSSFSDAWIMTE